MNEYGAGDKDVRRSTIEHNADRPRNRRPDHAAGHGRDAVAHRLHEVAADCRVPRAEARRARQAGDGDQGRGLDRPAVHRQHARLHPVLLEPRPHVLAEGMGSAARLAQLARQADRQHVPAAGQREDHRGPAAVGREPHLP